LILLLLVVVHLAALHEVGSNNPDGIEIKKNKGPDGVPLDGIPFHPYYTVKDLVGTVVFLGVFFLVVFFAPDMNGLFLEHANFEPADRLKTPEHIAPVWYFTPFYAILRAVPDKLFGVILMGLAIALLFLLPWLDRSPVKSMRYRSPIAKLMLGLFALSFIALGYFGLQPVTTVGTIASRLFTFVYFAFLLGMPWWSRLGTAKQEPERVTYESH